MLKLREGYDELWFAAGQIVIGALHDASAPISRVAYG